MKKKTMILILLPLIALGVIIFLFVNSFYGNPVSKMIVKSSAQKYLNEKFKDSDLHIASVGYNFKNSSYFVRIISKDSIDTHFTIYFDGYGHMKYDDFTDCVTNGWNTAMRLIDAYGKLVDNVLDREDFPYKSNIAYGELVFDHSSDYVQKVYSLNRAELELDKEYDIKELGKRYGHLVIYVDSAEVSEEKAAEILLDMKNRFDQANVPFYSVNFTLEQPKDVNKDGKRSGEAINLLYFLAEDIYEDALAERVHDSHVATDAYYQEMDKVKELEMNLDKELDQE